MTIDNTDNSQDVEISEQVLNIREGELEVPIAVVATGTDISYSISESGFSIDENTGVLSFVSSPDYEDVNEREYSLLVTVMNELSDASAMVTVEVEDVNDNAPTLLRLVDGGGDVVEDVIVAEGDVEILGTLVAEDVDTVGDLVYSIDDNVRFMLEEIGGDYVLKSKSVLDYEGVGVSDGTIVIQLTVYDGANETVVESLTITITDVDDELPTMLRLVDNVGDVVGNVIVAEGDVKVLGILTAGDVDTMGWRFSVYNR